MSVFSKMFGKYLLVTNTVSCGLMMAVGDAMQQRSDFLKKHMTNMTTVRATNELPSGDKETSSSTNIANDDETLNDRTIDFTKSITTKKTTIDNDEKIDENEESYDFARTRNMTYVGLLQGPFHHYFYMVLEKYLPGRNTASILKKTILDQTIASPTCLGIFFFGLGALERKNIDDINGEVKLKLLDTWKVDCMFWPPSQFVNFLLVPVRYRVIYINFMTMIYDMFLSYMKYDVHCP